MVNFQKAVEQAQLLVEQYAKYVAKPTKAESARMRKTINELRKGATAARADLIKEDAK